MFFKRNKSIDVLKKDNQYIVKVAFVDEYHDFVLTVNASFDLIITDANIRLNKQPYKNCNEMYNLIKKTIGTKVKKGYYKEIIDKLGGRCGCTHLIDIFQEVGRGLVQADIKSVELNKGRKAIEEMLKDSCVSYS